MRIFGGLDRLRVARALGGVGGGIRARQRGDHELIAGDPGQPAGVSAQQTERARYDRIENRLHIRLRATDDAQDVAGRGLRIQRLDQVLVTGLQLLEEAHVLDRDDGLVGKGLEKRDMPGGERPRLRSLDDDGPDRRAVGA